MLKRLFGKRKEPDESGKAAPVEKSVPDTAGEEAVPEPDEPQPAFDADGGDSKAGLFSRLKRGLTKTRTGFVQKITEAVTGRTRIDEELYEELEEILIQADVGVQTTLELVDRVRQRVKSENASDPSRVEGFLREELTRLLSEASEPLEIGQGLHVIVVVGVNGAGKTTTIGKLAQRFKSQGRKVVLGAADTFRAAAIDQLETWANRVGVDIVRHQETADPAAVAFDAIQAAKARGADVCIVDTAGRLQTKRNLMAELSKVYRVVSKALERDPDEVLLVIDATTGQNGMSQAKLFNAAVPVSGVALTKLDGTAKGGIIIGITAELGVPVKLIGIGESVDDLRDFVAKDFVAALFD